VYISLSAFLPVLFCLDVHCCIGDPSVISLSRVGATSGGYYVYRCHVSIVVSSSFARSLQLVSAVGCQSTDPLSSLTRCIFVTRRGIIIAAVATTLCLGKYACCVF